MADDLFLAQANLYRYFVTGPLTYAMASRGFKETQHRKPQVSTDNRQKLNTLPA